MDYAEIIKDYMKKNNVSYADLASAVGMSRQGLWITLNGSKNNDPGSGKSKSISLKTLERICNALGLEVGISEKSKR